MYAASQLIKSDNIVFKKNHIHKEVRQYKFKQGQKETHSHDTTVSGNKNISPRGLQNSPQVLIILFRTTIGLQVLAREPWELFKGMSRLFPSTKILTF